MHKFILKSGKKVELNLATIEQALFLYRTIVAACKGAGLDLTVTPETTVAELLDKNMEAKLNIMSSESVLEAVKDCCAKVIYDGQNFSMDLFEDEKNKQDFFPLMILIAIENIRPFFPQADIIFTAVLSQYLK